MLQHAWAEFERATVTRARCPRSSPDLDRRFTLAAGLLELPSGSSPRSTSGCGRATPESEPAILGRAAARRPGALLTERYTEAGWSRADHYGWVSGLLVELGITSTEALHGARQRRRGRLTRRMGYRNPAGCGASPGRRPVGGLRRALPGAHGNARREAALRARMAKLGRRRGDVLGQVVRRRRRGRPWCGSGCRPCRPPWRRAGSRPGSPGRPAARRGPARRWSAAGSAG